MMKIRRSLFFIVMVVVLFGLRDVETFAVGDFDELEPNDSLFSVGPDPYDLALRDALLGEHFYRKCQILAIPAFEKEWAVYMVREEGAPPRLFFKRMQKHFYRELFDAVEEKKKHYPSHREAEVDIIKSLRVEVEVVTADLDPKTADLLEEVWGKMLKRVRYIGSGTDLDTTTYHVSHHRRGEGFRSARTLSHDESSRPAALVSLAEAMCVLAKKPGAIREVLLRNRARALLDRLKNEKEIRPQDLVEEKAE